MNSVLRLATAFAAGVAVMYYLDPQTGRRRRAIVHDKGVAAGHEVTDYARSKGKHVVNHARGAAARTRAHVAHEVIDDDVLRDQVRSRLGHLIDKPIEVEVVDGRVVLSGSVSKPVLDELVDTVSAMPGVVHAEGRPTRPRAPDQATTSPDARH